MSLIGPSLIERDKEIEGEREYQKVGKVLESGQGSPWPLDGKRGPSRAAAIEQGREAPIHHIVFLKKNDNEQPANPLPTSL